jgi:hypothetical protein
MEFEDVIWFVVFLFSKYAHVLELPCHALESSHLYCNSQHLFNDAHCRFFCIAKNIGCLKSICALGCDEVSSFVDSFNILITFVSMIMAILLRFKLIVRHPYNEA